MAPSFELGTDPEALLIVKRTGRIRSPGDVIHDPDPHDKYGKATAIGKDGDRETSSFELRPGRSDSGVVLVNRMGDLINRLHKHYHPHGIAYRAGAFFEPEPLGGHIHFSWPQSGGLFGNTDYSTKVWQVCEILKGFRSMSDFLIPELFDATQIERRNEYARYYKKDFAGTGLSIRPASLDRVMEEAHVEYRYPPSWLDSPEAAYCFLGGAEYIVREVFDRPVGQSIDWSTFARKMFSDKGIAPPNSPSLAEAFSVARRFVNQEDFVENWI